MSHCVMYFKEKEREKRHDLNQKKVNTRTQQSAPWKSNYNCSSKYGAGRESEDRTTDILACIYPSYPFSFLSFLFILDLDWRTINFEIGIDILLSYGYCICSPHSVTCYHREFMHGV
ncbi:hypothetical protein PHYBLDRAFT_61177 [Phycomyces blakesleeanus NRRL 1555(-)]|uniref:Uncharacterized protein n=1 Tax=Phycomyces blakesleeanus (strain ATCC 8743b / DSM 1359 / FGSC 10004 / NBRC 33097 / NRRL 1555) TaxID=763407 RepID=A0A162XGR6_PHYB8|nr:hypothetical protein PHYBLDRAFT_61177 [Phycomyces blakesleeanus NRRL 1555(-)]OAD74775.1 hypothetical protein PHYBLDRAFT_61177 [Phycomyces blakesleeanus NRRL 1555(-)]|eukprot:XP_018292815.1 hypothetical protein PHYBLDRAFT_61177 [Phycomyces blakesleeanus NRRL 1555(-)]